MISISGADGAKGDSAPTSTLHFNVISQHSFLFTDATGPNYSNRPFKFFRALLRCPTLTDGLLSVQVRRHTSEDRTSYSPNLMVDLEALLRTGECHRFLTGALHGVSCFSVVKDPSIPNQHTQPIQVQLTPLSSKRICLTHITRQRSLVLPIQHQARHESRLPKGTPCI